MSNGGTPDLQSAPTKKPLPLCCSFCGKSQDEVRRLVAGPTVFICDECIELCMDIIREDRQEPVTVEEHLKLINLLFSDVEKQVDEIQKKIKVVLQKVAAQQTNTPAQPGN